MSKSTCPVCGDDVEVERHTPKKLYGGVIYHFCSEDHRMDFKRDPKEYTSSRSRAGAYS